MGSPSFFFFFFFFSLEKEINDKSLFSLGTLVVVMK